MELQNWVSYLKDTRLILAAVIIISQVYFVNLTRPTPNFDSTTQTVYYGTNDDVVKQPVTPTHAVIVTLLTAALLYVCMKKENKFGIIDKDEAISIARNDIARLSRSDDRFKGSYTGQTDYTLRRLMIHEEMTPNRYILFTEIVHNPDMGIPSFWYRQEINPATGRIERAFEESTPLRPELLCTRCGQGNTADFKVVTGQDFAIFKDIKESIGGTK